MMQRHQWIQWTVLITLLTFALPVLVIPLAFIALTALPLLLVTAPMLARTAMA